MKKFFLLLLLNICLLQASSIEQKAQKMAEHWKHTLALDDWTVHISLVDLKDIRPGTLANSRWDRPSHVAYLRVLKPSAYKDFAREYKIPELKGDAITRDIENSVIHELVHLRLSELMAAGSDTLQDEEEHTVVRLTDALLAARSGK